MLRRIMKTDVVELYHHISIAVVVLPNGRFGNEMHKLLPSHKEKKLQSKEAE